MNVLAAEADEMPDEGEDWKGVPTAGTPEEQMWRARQEAERDAVAELIDDAAERTRYYVRRLIPHWRRNRQYH